MEIEQQIWGATSEGEAVVLYTLRNAAGAEVRLCNVGAAVVSILVPDRDGHLADVALGYKDFRSYFGDPALCGKSIGRVAGCIAYGTMRIDGEEYRLDINGMAGHLNGGVKGFAGRLWESRVETNRVVMSFSSDDGDQGYPGNLQVEAAFDFDEDNALEITYIARTDRTTPVNMACNLLLNLGGEGSGSVLDHELRLNAERVLETDDRLIPTGKLIDVTGTPADFRSLRRLGEGIDSDFDRIRMLRGYDHFFPVDGWRQNILTEVGELRDARSGRRVEILSSQPGVTLYTGNRLGGGCPETKSGGHYRDYDAVLAMYHDQGLTPFKTLSPDGVNFTACLGCVRTSPDHGVAFDIAGQDKADPQSMRNAIYLATDIVNNRRAWAEWTSNPLPHAERERGGRDLSVKDLPDTEKES